jgi:hypothetical protein
MTMSTPISDPTTTDEMPTTIQRDRVLLHRLDGHEVTIEPPRRLNKLVRMGGRIYELRGVDQKKGGYVRIYWETRVDDIRIVGPT